MKFTKYLVALAFAFCAFTSISKAQTAVFVGGGSSAVFNELGAGINAISGVTCFWSHAKQANNANPGYMAYRDTRPSPVSEEQGDVFVAWTPGTGTGASCTNPQSDSQIYLYMKLDSVQGDRCYFATDALNNSGCTLIMTNMASFAGTSIVPGVADNPVNSAMPAAILAVLSPASGNPPRLNVAGTDIRAEDAKFQTQRMFTPCDAAMPRQYFNQDSYYLFGLGYQTTTPHQGTQILEQAAAGTNVFNVNDFSISGTDPFTGGNVPSFTTYTIGAQPVVVAVSPVSDGNIAAMTDIPGFTLALFLQGVLGRTSDIATGPGDEALTVLIREPLSGTYNTMEYSIPNGTQFHGSQDYGNCTGSPGKVSSNPMNMASANGVVGGAARIRAIGTGDVTKYLKNATSPSLGYFFWSSGNASGLSRVKYLKVNGVDPILTTTSLSGCTTPPAYNGTLPGSGGTGDPTLACVGFSGLNAGDYPIWSALRLIGPSSGTVATAISNALTGLHTIDGTQHDYIALSNLKVWHSHFYLNGGSVTPANVGNGFTINTANDLCTGSQAEAGGDAGGATMLIANNKHFCSDFSNSQGLLNKTQ